MNWLNIKTLLNILNKFKPEYMLLIMSVTFLFVGFTTPYLFLSIIYHIASIITTTGVLMDMED